jgi:glutaredoxin
MLKIIGTENCGRCNIVLNLLKEKEVRFDYAKLKDLPNEEQILLMDKAKQKKQLSFPLILKDGELVTLQEVIV